MILRSSNFIVNRKRRVVQEVVQNFFYKQEVIRSFSVFYIYFGDNFIIVGFVKIVAS